MKEATLFRVDILPRLIPDSHVATHREAFEEAARRKASPVAPDAVTRLEESPCGGYRVYTVSMNLAMEMFADFAEAGVAVGGSAKGPGSVYGNVEVER